jgi:hypothetical protein
MAQHVEYNEAFWITIAAAAPVIALASTVLITDTKSLYDLTDEEQRYFSVLRYITLPVFLSSANVVSQTITLYAALISIAHHSNFTNFSRAILLEVAGMQMIFLITIINVLGHEAAKKAKRISVKDEVVK